MSMLDENGDVVKRTGSEDDKEKANYVKDFVEGSYYDEKVATEAKKYYDKVQSTIDGLKKDHTVKEEIDALKALATEAKGKIDAKYKEVFAAAKTKAGKAIDTLYKGSSTEDMSATDISAMVALAKADLEKASTLKEIGEVIDSTGSSVKVGKYDEVERMRAAAFDAIDSSIKSVYEKDPSLNPGTTDADKKAYAAFLTQLKTFGVSEDQLPTKVYETYKAKISAATSFEYVTNSDGEKDYSKSTLQKEATKAISSANSNILSVVRKAVLDSYYAEIDASENLTTEESKTACKGAVETAISEWFLANSASSVAKATVTNFISSSRNDGNEGTGEEEAVEAGGVLYIENMLDKNYVSFQSERLTNKKNSIKSTIKAAAEKIIDSDELYKKLLNVTYKDDNAETENPEYESLNDAAEDLGVSEKTITDILAFTAPTNDGRTLSDGTYNLRKYYISLVTDRSGVVKDSGNDGGYIGKSSNLKKVRQLISYENTLLGNLKKVYENAVNKFWTSEKPTSVALNETYLFGKQALESKMNALKTSDDTITTLKEKLDVKNSKNWVGLADSLSYKYRKYWQNKYNGENTYYNAYGRLPLSEVYKTVDAALGQIVSGEIKTYSDIEDVISGLDDEYAATINAYYTTQVNLLSAIRDGLVNSETSGIRREEINAAYENWKSVANSGFYVFSSYESVDGWFNMAKTDLNDVYVYDNDSSIDGKQGNPETDLAHKIQNKVSRALSYVEDYEDVVEIDGKVLTEDEKNYIDVAELFYSMKKSVYSEVWNGTQKNYSSSVDEIIKYNSETKKYEVNANGNYTTDKIEAAKDLGKTRSEALANLKKVYNAAVKAVAGDDASAKKANLLAIYNAEVKKLEDTRICGSEDNIDALIKIDNTVTDGVGKGYSGASVDLLVGNSDLTAYKDSVKAEALAYFEKAWVEHPELAGDLRNGNKVETTAALNKQVDEAGTATKIEELLEEYKDSIDEIIG